jgi:hypothetical protein
LVLARMSAGDTETGRNVRPMTLDPANRLTIEQAEAILHHAILSAAYEDGYFSGDGHWIARRLALNPCVDIETERAVLSAASEGIRLDPRLTPGCFTGPRRVLFGLVRQVEAQNVPCCPVRLAWAILDAGYLPHGNDPGPIGYEAGQCELTPLRLDQSALSRLRELQARRRARQATARLFLSLPTASPAELKAALKAIWAALAAP